MIWINIIGRYHIVLFLFCVVHLCQWSGDGDAFGHFCMLAAFCVFVLMQWWWVVARS